MPHFTDKTGRKWTVELTIGTVRDLKNRLDFDLLGTKIPDVIERLSSDQMLTCDCLYVICEEQAQKHEIDDIAFGRLMSGPALWEGANAIWTALADFIPDPRGREHVAKVIQTFVDLAQEAHNQMDETLETAAAELMEAATAGRVFSKLPDAPASNPGD